MTPCSWPTSPRSQLRDKLARLPGVGDVIVFGIGEYSMRIWLDPELMRQRSLTPKDVMNAIQRQNAKVAAGQIGMPPTPAGQDFQLTVNVAGRAHGRGPSSSRSS